jgi:hypothetical protein
MHNEELHNLYSSPDTIRIIKSRRLRWPGYSITHGGVVELKLGFGRKARRKDTRNT